MFRFKELGVCVISLQIVFSGMGNVGLGQTVKDIFGNKEINLLDNFDFFDGSLLNSKNLLGLSKEQQEEFEVSLAKIDALIRASEAATKMQHERGEPYSGPKIFDFEKMKWVKFMSMLNDEQNLRLTQYLLVKHVELLAKYEMHPSIHPQFDSPLQSFIFCSAFANWLGVTDEQNKRLQKAKREAELAWENLPKDLPVFDQEAAEAKFFVQWQEALHELLLPHQQSSFKNALGKEATYLRQYFDKYSDTRIFLLDPSRINKTYSSGIFHDGDKKPGIDRFLKLTNPHLDAKIHPYALFDLLLTKEVTKDLKLNELQVDQLTRMKENWFNKNPFDIRELKYEREMGLTMTTQVMRERAETFDKKYGRCVDQVEQILSPPQRDRLRQLGNQFMISRGWYEVPLSCPEWLDYLELTQDQRSKFEQVNTRFRIGHERMGWDMYEPIKQIERDLENKISEILTEKQIETLLEFKAIAD